MSKANKREYFRIGLKIPLSAQLKIVGINNILVDTKYARIFVTDISAGGLRVHSKLDLPLNIDLLLEFMFSLFHSELKVLGTIVRKSAISSTMYEYGIRFSLDENQHTLLMGHLNLLSIRLRQSNIISSCSFCSEEEMKQFYSAK
ncbi:MULTISPECIES: PilZ domain-containing protein [unclassified Paenibacillus]|uniref:PilZ domain-containing protein n=1 Tax=unclassified Paenibacillus TaxID=185978 RepID=UPI00363B715F